MEYALNRIQSSRRLERECQRNLELMWLTGRLAPDFKTIADFRHDNGKGIRNVCRRFVMLCRELDLFSQAVVAIDGSKFRCDFIYIARDDQYQCPAGQRAVHRFTTDERGQQIRLYWSSACPRCPMKEQCTTSAYRRIRRWEHEAVMESVQQRLDQAPDAMRVRRRTVEHVFGTLKHWMGSTHFLTRRLAHVGTEMSLHVLAYNLKRVMHILGIGPLIQAMRVMGA